MAGNIWVLFDNGLRKLFIPSSDYFNQKTNSITSQYAWVSVIFSSGKDLVEVMKGNYTVAGKSKILSFKIGSDGAPVLVVPIKQSKSKYNLGDNVEISFAWFEPYRDDFHALVSAFLLLAFIWNTFKSLPNIINGINSGVQVSTQISSDSDS